MNKLSALVPLKSKITVYVPATVSVDQEIDNAAYSDFSSSQTRWTLSASRVLCPPVSVVLRLRRFAAIGSPILASW